MISFAVLMLALIGLAALFGRRHRKRITPDNCQHGRATSRKWLDKDQTPMIWTHCPDCGFTDRGHVYADPETWLSE